MFLLCNCQEEREDVILLFEKEMVSLERCQRKREQEVLSAIVEVKKLFYVKFYIFNFFNGVNSIHYIIFVF